jgi:hypothetical protein
VTRYNKAIAAAVAGLAEAAVLLPTTDVPWWMLALGALGQTLVVARAPKNRQV